MEDFLREREEYLKSQEEIALQKKANRKNKKTPRITVGGKSYRLDSLMYKSKADRAELIESWFFERYEDPANSTPYESAEGGYIYIWGGPYDAHEILSDVFSGHIDGSVIDDIADDLNSISPEWERIPTEEDYKSYYDEDTIEITLPKYLESFRTSIEHSKTLLDIDVQGETRRHLLGLIHVSVITTLETYLMEAFMFTLSDKDKFMANFVSYSDFESGAMDKASLLKPDEVQEMVEDLKKRAQVYLMNQLWHNLNKVRENYSKTFGIQFENDGMTELKTAVGIRHDLVHRNGVSTTGIPVPVSEETVRDLVTRVEAVVRHIEAEIQRVTTPVVVVPEQAIDLVPADF
ncbi:HEPN-associated N-terminal domain-containing protein [Aeromonas sobria]|uniref:HEPN-associated N-terminal domain-containing protein n=1 Tax=Aeromonas sobria TaxID=646 RepID=UPI000C6E62D5|nr:HEPN-associated N-terminal domain-containing protein [Aeromonas sobria]PKQ78076.1 hypothetical protein CJF47_07290 [Aeromonas sobria]